MLNKLLSFFSKTFQGGCYEAATRNALTQYEVQLFNRKMYYGIVGEAKYRERLFYYRTRFGRFLQVATF